MSEQVQIEIIRALSSSIPGVIAAIFGYLGLRQSKKNYHQMNSRMDEMLELKGRESEAVGELRGELKERETRLQRDREIELERLKRLENELNRSKGDPE